MSRLAHDIESNEPDAFFEYALPFFELELMQWHKKTRSCAGLSLSTPNFKDFYASIRCNKHIVSMCSVQGNMSRGVAWARV